MPLFHYQANDRQGKPTEGEMEASDRNDLANRLNTKGFLLISATEKTTKVSFGQKEIFSGGLNLLDRYLLFEDLATMVKAGLAIDEALKILQEDADKLSLKKLLIDFQFTIEQGHPLSFGIEKYPQYFSPIVVNLIKAGEVSGNLDQALKTIATQFRKEGDLKRKITSAMIYPAILFVLSVFVIIFMLVFVVPRLSVFFAQANIDLPIMTKLIVGIGALLSGSPLADLAIFLFIMGFFIFLRKSKVGKEILIEFVSRFPLTKRLFRTLSVYRYCWTMGVLISSGVGILDGITITKDVLTGKRYKESMIRIRDSVEKGVPLGVALREQGKLFPNIVAGMTKVGEQTGNLQNIYVSLAKFYERNFGSALKGLVTLVEPLLLLVMGGIVGGIALAIILPIYQFVSAVS